MKTCPRCGGTVFVRDSISHEFIDADGKVISVERNVKKGIPTCVQCGYTGEPVKAKRGGE